MGREAMGGSLNDRGKMKIAAIAAIIFIAHPWNYGVGADTRIEGDRAHSGYGRN